MPKSKERKKERKLKDFKKQIMRATCHRLIGHIRPSVGAQAALGCPGLNSRACGGDKSSQPDGLPSAEEWAEADTKTPLQLQTYLFNDRRVN